jgi:hypothetical protein
MAKVIFVNGTSAAVFTEMLRRFYQLNELVGMGFDISFFLQGTQGFIFNIAHWFTPLILRWLFFLVELFSYLFNPPTVDSQIGVTCP